MKKTLFIFLALFLYTMAFAQNLQVGGVVKSSDDGQPMTGVSIIIQGVTKIGTITDIDGKYSIKVPKGKSIVFSYIGYIPQTKQVNASMTLDIVMQTNTKMLDEVVAVGYGTMKKSDVTGAVSTIKGGDLQKTPASGLDQALQGKAAGVTVNANTGQPGAEAVVRIRGIGTINGSSPIYVVDGIILENISFLSPNDIESTEILKDASATAIYGSRGANGVIIVTTKKGKSGQNNLSFSAYTGTQNRWKKLDLMQRDEFVKTLIALNNVTSEKNYLKNYGFNKWLSAYRLGTSPYYPVVKSTLNPNGFDYSSVETDWQDEVFNPNAVVQNYHLSIDGGNEKDKYSISASYFNQDGTVIGSNYERLTLRINSSHKVRNWITVGENLSFQTSTGRNAMNNNSSPGASILSAALAMAPWDPTHYPQGAVNVNGKDLSGQISASSNFRNVTNPFSMVENSVPKDIVERWVGNVYAEISPIKDLTLRSSVSIDLSNNSNQLFKYAYLYSDYDKVTKNFFTSSMSRYSTLTFENILTYNKSFGKNSLTAMLGQTTEEYNYHSISGSGFSILNPTENNWLLSKTTDEPSRAGEDAARARRFSLLSRVHYSFDSKYMITMNFRADASSKFPEHLWGYFPSTALAWRISEEPWMKGIQNMDNMKIRFGWGQIGNDKVGSDAFNLTMFNSGPTFVDYVFGQTQQLANGATVLTYVNAGGKWETTEQINAAVDFAFFNGLISGSVDVFNRDTKDMILPVTAPAQVGNRYSPSANVGTVRNQGIEITLEHHNKIGKINYSLNGNVSFINNKLIALNGGSRLYFDRTTINEGDPLFTFWGYKYLGVYQTDAEATTYLPGYKAGENPFKAGDAKFADLNGDGKIDLDGNNDKTALGNPFPWLTYGLNASADYMGFDIQLFFQGVYGNKIYNAERERTEGKGLEATLSTTMRDVWTASNPTGSIPNPYGSSISMYNSSRFLEDGAYLRLKNVQIGYTIQANITKQAKINRIRVYASANNLLTFTNYTGYDPEVGSGVDYGNYPQSRTIMLGINVDF